MENKAPHFSALLFLLISLVLFPTAKCGIVTYWGQGDQGEGTLTEACNSGLYGIVVIAFLSEFGNGKAPQVNLASHCNTVPNCPKVGHGIKNCQNKNVKVLLSIGGSGGGYGLTSANEANQVADYLWNNFLGGQSNSRPFGDAVLDGIDFDIEGNNRGDPENYAVLAMKLREHMDNNNQASGRKFYLSAAPQCPFPDHNQNPALSKVYFNFVFIQFYNNPDCQVDSNNFQSSWNRWTTSSIKAHKFYVGLLAARTRTDHGYVSTDTVLKKVLPFVKKSSNYGGVMLWKRELDKKSGFSAKIHDSVNK